MLSRDSFLRDLDTPNRFPRRADDGPVPSQSKTTNESFRLRSRRSLITAVFTLQALVIGVGWYFTVQSQERQVADRALDEVLEERRCSVERFASLLEHEIDGPLIPGMPEWDRAQSFVEAYRLPQGATLMVLDETGVVICHPELRGAESLFKADFGLTQLDMRDGSGTMPLGAVRSTRGVLGHARGNGGEIAVAAVHSPKLQALVVAKQPRVEMTAPGLRVTDGVTVTSGIAALAVLAICGLGSIILVRRYDSMFETLNKELSREVDRQVASGLRIRNGIIMGLAKLADHRDNDTGSHLERIGRYCELLSRELEGTRPEITDAWIERLIISSAMHDIGKVGVPDAILLKPGALTLPERRVMERHPLIGADTLVEVRRHVGEDDLVDMATQVSLYHHEKWDGAGYPFGLQGEEIPLSARIVALADVYDALTSWRVYKDAMPHTEAVRVIMGSRGTHFDPAVADAFERLADRFDEVRREVEGRHSEKTSVRVEAWAA